MNLVDKMNMVVGVSILSSPMIAQTKEAGILDWSVTNVLVIISVLMVAIAFYILLNVTTKLMEMQKFELYQKMGVEIKTTDKSKTNISVTDLIDKLYKKLTNYVPVEKEADVDLGHDYDGIRELDNSLPPWWLYLFYFTIAFSAIYLYWYHVSGKGTLIKKEYEYNIAALEQLRADYLASVADAVNETNVTRLTDETSIAEGASIFKRNCVACHLESGGGNIGPNLTDQYWIHGGGIKNIFAVIKHGVPEKGMISWKAQLTPKQIQQVASFIMSLEGTNPPDAKAPEGELYIATAEVEDNSQKESDNNN